MGYNWTKVLWQEEAFIILTAGKIMMRQELTFLKNYQANTIMECLLNRMVVPIKQKFMIIVRILLEPRQS